MTAWDRRDGTRDMRCVHTREAQPRLHLRAECVAPDVPAARVFQDALLLPRVWGFGARLGPVAPLLDHGHVVGVDVVVSVFDPEGVWNDAAGLHHAARPSPIGVGPALERAAAAHAETSHDLATLATLDARPGTPRQVRAETLVADVVRAARRLAEDAPAPVRVVVTGSLGPGPAEVSGDSTIRLPRSPRPPSWLEVWSPRADLAYLQLRRSIPAVYTVRDLAATLIANQAVSGPYRSTLDARVRSREAVSYLWDCVTDLVRGEFVMLAAPDPMAVDHVVSIVRAAHTDTGTLSARSVDGARRIVRTQVLRRFAWTHAVLLAHGEAQRSGLPARLWADLPGALRDVTVAEVCAALAGVVAEPFATTLVVPTRGQAASTVPAT